MRNEKRKGPIHDKPTDKPTPKYGEAFLLKTF